LPPTHAVYNIQKEGIAGLGYLLYYSIFYWLANYLNSGEQVEAVALTISRWVTPLELDFGLVGVGDTSPQQIVTLTNTGLTPLTGWAGGAVPPPFQAAQDCNISGSVLPGNSCHFIYTFSPSSPGFFSATSSFSTNAGTIHIKMQGQGLPSIFLPTMLK
jgi:hypothetical protein